MITLQPNTAGTNLAFTAAVSPPAADTNLVFLLERQGSVFAVRTSPPPHNVTFSNLPAGKYYLAAQFAGSAGLADGSLSFDIRSPSLAPLNDRWAQPALMLLNSTRVGANTFAASEPGEPVHAGVGSGKSIWWAWTAVSNGVFTATTRGSAFDTVLGLYTGKNVAMLAEVAANDDAGPYAFSQVSFNAIAGKVYYFVVDSAQPAASGSVQLRLAASSPPQISITTPSDGALFLVNSPSGTVNTPVAATVQDAAVVARVDYYLDGGGVAESGTLAAPYQVYLTNLPPAHYVLTLVASNMTGLVSSSSIGFSIISLAPELMIEKYVASLGSVEMGITGFKGRNYIIQASTNLDVWCGVSTLTNFAGAQKLSETNVARFNRRFYRAAGSP